MCLTTERSWAIKRYVSCQLVLQILEQVEHLRLHRDVQGGDGFVTHDELGIDGQRPGDADALPLAPRKLVGIPLGVVRR